MITHMQRMQLNITMFSKAPSSRQLKKNIHENHID